MPILLTAALALAAPSSLEALSGATFCSVDELNSLRHFEPDQWTDTTPRSIEFPGPNKVQLNYGQDGETCSFTAVDQGLKSDLTLTCDGRKRHATWEETGPETVVTSLLAEDGKRMTVTRCTYPDMDAIEKSFAQGYASTHRGAFTGTWLAADGATVEVTGAGHVTLEGLPLDTAVRRCDDDGRPRACLMWKVGTGTQAARRALVLKGTPLTPALVEAALSTDEGYYPVEIAKNTRTFVKQSRK